MKITINRTPEQVELIKAIGSKNKDVSLAAQDIIAASIGKLIQTVINRASVAGLIYSDFEYNQDTNPSIPLDLYVDKKEDYVRVWQQTLPGGLPSNFIQGLQELKFGTYELDSAVSMLKKYARLGDLNNLARAIKRMAQEILSKQEYNAFIPLLASLATAQTNNLSHVIASSTSGVFQVDDLNRLWTRARKINAAWDGGTPEVGGAKGLTDLYVSPEIMEDVRSFAYQPMNTRAVPNTDESTVLGLPDKVREEIYRAAGTSEIFGVTLHELLELSPESSYNVVFDNYYNGSFTAGTNQIVIGIDNSREAFLRPVEVDDQGGQLIVAPDDQFPARADKLGFYAKVTEGRVVLDDRAITGIVV